MSCHCGLDIEKWYIKEAVIPEITTLLKKEISLTKAFELCSEFHKVSLNTLRNEYEKHIKSNNDN